MPRPALEPVSLASFASDLDRLMRPLILAKGAIYETSVKPSELAVTADPDMLQQAVINLLKNAVDAVADVEAPRIELCCRAEADRIVLTVSDNGLGLPEDDLDRLFIPFFTTKSGGSGVGLNLALQIALAHHGQLTVRRNQPRGAVFEMTLPRANTP